eukprot:TRINITY_DN8959_c0_g1_i1.p1 TRINITY_DN8959_c0_g1~~TRINITY_DN8959_c0_g1_i1.p1  ORF type:complete len:186 (+),score=12.11 TRINITY_DN8959_c0_g1_i1:44-601(+)
MLTAWHSDPAQCQQIILKACNKVLNEPIVKEEWEWFKHYVVPSSIWLFETSKHNNYMYQELLKIARKYSEDITKSMDSIYELLQRDDRWKNLMAIKNETIISRQDDKRCGLLRELCAIKTKDATNEDVEEIEMFMDGNVAVNILVATAKRINPEFQTYLKTVMGHYGQFQDGPLKKVERCQSKRK